MKELTMIDTNYLNSKPNISILNKRRILDEI